MLAQKDRGSDSLLGNCRSSDSYNGQGKEGRESSMEKRAVKKLFGSSKNDIIFPLFA